MVGVERAHGEIDRSIQNQNSKNLGTRMIPHEKFLEPLKNAGYVDVLHISTCPEAHAYRCLKPRRSGHYVGCEVRVYFSPTKLSIKDELGENLDVGSSFAQRAICNEYFVPALGYDTHEFEIDGKTDCFVITEWPYMKRGCLQNLVVNGPHSAQFCCEILLNVAKGLDLMHDAQLGGTCFHHNVRPSSIFLDRGNRTRLAVGGISHQIRQHAISKSHFCDAPRYVVQETPKRKTRSPDVFGFFVVYAELRLGRHPYPKPKKPLNENQNFPALGNFGTSPEGQFVSQVLSSAGRVGDKSLKECLGELKSLNLESTRNKYSSTSFQGRSELLPLENEPSIYVSSSVCRDGYFSVQVQPASSLTAVVDAPINSTASESKRIRKPTLMRKGIPARENRFANRLTENSPDQCQESRKREPNFLGSESLIKIDNLLNIPNKEDSVSETEKDKCSGEPIEFMAIVYALPLLLLPLIFYAFFGTYSIYIVTAVMTFTLSLDENERVMPFWPFWLFSMVFVLALNLGTRAIIDYFF